MIGHSYRTGKAIPIPPDYGDLPDRLDRRKVYRYRDYCVQIGENGTGEYLITLADALDKAWKGMAKGMADNPEIRSGVIIQDCLMRWVPKHWDGGQLILGEWEHDIIDGAQGYEFSIVDGKVVEEKILLEDWVGYGE